jgi:hypothetical protein
MSCLDLVQTQAEPKYEGDRYGAGAGRAGMIA